MHNSRRKTCNLMTRGMKYISFGVNYVSFGRASMCWCARTISNEHRTSNHECQTGHHYAERHVIFRLFNANFRMWFRREALCFNSTSCGHLGCDIALEKRLLKAERHMIVFESRTLNAERYMVKSICRSALKIYHLILIIICRSYTLAASSR